MDPIPLSDEARQAMRDARHRAGEEGFDRAGREHILFALLDAPGAGRLLGAFGTPAPLVQQVLQHGPHVVRTGTAERDAEEAIVARAASEARRLGQPVIGSEHLLLGLLGPTDTPVARLLAVVGITRDPAREAVRFLHGQVPDWDRPEQWVREGQGSGYVVGGYDLVVDPDAEPPSSDELARYEAMARAADEGSLRLLRVVAIGATAEVDGTTVELIALEVREGIAILYWRARSTETMSFGLPEVRVTDDVGTAFDAFSGSTSGGEHMMSGELHILPPPPDAASVLRIEFLSFAAEVPFLPPRERTVSDGRPTGPWSFAVDLGGGSVG